MARGHMNQEDIQQQLQLQKIEVLKNQIMNKILTKDALERLGRVKYVNPQLAGQVEVYLLQIYQTGKITQKINDSKIKDVLKTLSEPKKNIKIKRR